METVESLNWLRDHKLYRKAKRDAPRLKKIFTTCLNVTDERILIIGDLGSKKNRVAPMLAGSYYNAAKELNLNTKLVFQTVKTRGQDAEEHVIRALDELDSGDIILINMSDKLGGLGKLGKSFRKFCKKKKSRFVSALSLGDLENEKLVQVIDAVDTNYKVMELKIKKIKSKLDKAKKVRVTTDKGTDLHYDVEGMEAQVSDGNYTIQGDGGNLPAGEVYIPPSGKEVNGTIVVDGSSRNHEHTLLVKKPIRLTVENGDIVNIEGGKAAKKLEETLEWAANHSKYPGSVRRICELGIGVNPNAKVIGSTLVDEKALGTAHFGIGSNHWFGGTFYAIIHIDQIFHNPKIEVDGELLEY